MFPPKKILVMGLPGTGKTYLSERLSSLLGFKHLNADIVRKESNDWDFSHEGRLRQAKRMKEMADAEINAGRGVIADFVCPLPETRDFFDPDTIIWMNTKDTSPYQDTNSIFVPPKNSDYIIDTHIDGPFWAHHIYKKITGKKWDNKLPTVQMLGRWQPWHPGHRALFERAHKKTGQVCIMIRDCHGIGENIFDTDDVEQRIHEDLSDKFERDNDYIIRVMPNIVNITYGRKVGYTIEQEHFTDEIHAISATEIRRKMREDNKI